MYSIPSPVIKKLLDYCDLPSAIVLARVTKRCSSIFSQYREEILIRGEYVNVPNMFRHCSDEFIIRMSKHEFFSRTEAHVCCTQMRYKLHEKLGYGKLFWGDIDRELLREICRNGEYDNVSSGATKWRAAKIRIDLDIPYSNDGYGLHAAIILRNEEMINKLSNYGNFYVYCTTGYYHLADNYDIFSAAQCINESNDPVATFNYIEKRNYKFKDIDYFAIEHYEVLKKVLPRITKFNYCYVATKDFNALMLIYNTLIKFATIDKFFNIIINKNTDFTRFLLQKHDYLKNKIILRNCSDTFIIELLDLLDNNEIMYHACQYNRYALMRILIRHNDREWARQFKHPFIEKYY